MTRFAALVILTALLPGCVSTPTTRAPAPVASVAPPDNILWARKDGRRMATDPELYQQGTIDKEYCAQEASVSGQLDFPAFAKCMDRSGYVQMKAQG
jgi:PBP1b-binding outer membrane lipoprotein LpoB